MDMQVKVGLIAAGLALGWIAHQHGLLPWIARQMRARRAWARRRRPGLPAPECDRWNAHWQSIANGPNRRWL